MTDMIGTTEQKYVLLSSRDQREFKIPISVAMKSEVIKARGEKNNETFYINRSAEDINNLIDYMSGYKHKETEVLAELVNELKVKVGKEVETKNAINNMEYGSKIISLTMYKEIEEYKMKIYHDILVETNNEDYQKIIENQKNINIKESIKKYIGENQMNKGIFDGDEKLRLLELELTDLSKKNRITEIKIFCGLSGYYCQGIDFVVVKYTEESGNMSVFKINKIGSAYRKYENPKEFGEFLLFDLIKVITKNSYGYIYEILFKKV